MATLPKAGDSTATALSAIEEAVSKAAEEAVKSTQAAPENDSKSTTTQRPRMPGVTDTDLGPAGKSGLPEKPAPRQAATEKPQDKPAPARASMAPANDDRPSVGQVLQALQQRPSRSPLVLAWLGALVWLGLAGYYGWMTWQSGELLDRKSVV